MITEASIERLRDAVRECETPERFSHTERVEREAVAIGSILLPERLPALRAAALLHDLTKSLSPKEHLSILAERGCLPDPVTCEAVPVLHGFSSAAIIPERFPDFNDPEILEAVRCHTTGKPGMTDFEKILFVADFTEDGRIHQACREARKCLWEDPTVPFRERFEKTLLKILADTLRHLEANGKPIAPRTKEAYDFYRNLRSTGDTHGANTESE